MRFVLTICVGNICRSPMAQGILAESLDEAIVVSAGISALVGYPADPIAVELMAKRGIDISKHRAQQINLSMCKQAEIILVMDDVQLKYIERNYPLSRGKVFKIAQDEKRNVPDPYMKDRVFFEESLSLITTGASRWIERIKKL